MGQKVNGISVSGPPKIGERPYPKWFHPVEITPKIVENPWFQGQNSSNTAKIIVTSPNLSQLIPQNTFKYAKNTDLQVLMSSLDRGTRISEAQ